jgi:hypothetical protein
MVDMQQPRHDDVIVDPAAGTASVLVPVPEPSVQQHIHEVERRRQEALSRLKRSQCEFDALFASLQHRAFRGGL